MLRATNRDCLRDNGSVLYLHASPQMLWHRVRHNRHRPLLNTPDPLARLQDLYTQRDALYREVADWIIESDREQVARFAANLEDQLRKALGA